MLCFCFVVEFKYMKKSRMLYFTLAILIGVLMFVYAEADDSPGGQLIGLLVIIIGIAGLIASNKKTFN